MKIILVGCGKTKLTTPAAAKDLYVGPLFKARRAFAEASGCPWFVLSALHHIVPPDRILEPYDYTIAKDKGRLHEFGMCIFRTSEFEGVVHRGDTIEIHAGIDYCLPIIQENAGEGNYYDITTPMKGLEIGEQLAWYKSHRENP